jgi:hypothetical protein
MQNRLRYRTNVNQSLGCKWLPSVSNKEKSFKTLKPDFGQEKSSGHDGEGKIRFSRCQVVLSTCHFADHQNA